MENRKVSRFPEHDPNAKMLAPVQRNGNGRISGRMYDYHSRIDLGYASDEMKAEYQAGRVYTRIVAGLRQEFFIEP